MTDRTAIRYLVLWITGSCNLNCRYCYRGETNRFGPISFDTAKAALNMVASSGMPFHVQLTGGEPCMEPVLIEKIAAWIRKSGLNASIGLQTNGTLLDETMARIFRKYKIEIGLSIDGIEPFHNAHRAAFRQTLRGLMTLMQTELPCRVTTVVTRQNASQLDKLALMLAGFENVQGLGLDLLIHKGNAVHHRVSDVDQQTFGQGVTAFLDTLEMINNSRVKPLRFREQDQYLRCQTRDRINMPCHAAKGESLAVYPDGKLFPCSQTSGDDAFCCGTLDDVQWGRLRISKRGADCPSRTHYNRGKNLALQSTLFNALAAHTQKRSTV